VELSDNQAFLVGEEVTIAGVTVGGNVDPGYNGSFMVSSVSSDPSTGNTIITYQAVNTPGAATADAGTGTATPNTYLWYLDYNMDGNMDVGNSIDSAAFHAELGHRLAP
jgi:hypothetical protein